MEETGNAAYYWVTGSVDTNYARYVMFQQNISTGGKLIDCGLQIRCVLSAEVQQEEWGSSEEWNGGTVKY